MARWDFRNPGFWLGIGGAVAAALTGDWGALLWALAFALSWARNFGRKA